jgi:uncharacterized protein involved in exopolysaccharide biosynthesis
MIAAPKSSLRDIAAVPFKHWGVIASSLGISLLAATGYILIAEPEYTATSKLLVQIGREKTASLALERQPSYNVSFQERPQNINNEIEILRDPTLMERLLPSIKAAEARRETSSVMPNGILRGVALWATAQIRATQQALDDLLTRAGLTRHLPPDQELVLRLLRRLDVNFTKETDVINVSFTANDPNLAAFVVNAYVTAYQEQHVKVLGDENSSGFYKGLLENAQSDLDATEGRIAALLGSGDISNLEAEKSLALNYLGELDKELNQSRIALNDTQQKLAAIENRYKRTGEWLETPEAGDAEAGMRALDQSYVSLSGERTRLLARFAPAYPAVVSIKQQLRQLREQKYAALKTYYGARGVALRDRVAALTTKSEAKKADLAGLNARTLDYERLTQRRTELRAEVAGHRQKIEDLRIREDLDARNVTSVRVISEAVPPLTPSAPRRALVLALAGFIGLLFGVAYAVIAEFFNHTFRHEHDVRRVLDLPLLSVVPRLGR